jgi:hypothetical protein
MRLFFGPAKMEPRLSETHTNSGFSYPGVLGDCG